MQFHFHDNHIYAIKPSLAMWDNEHDYRFAKAVWNNGLKGIEGFMVTGEASDETVS